MDKVIEYIGIGVVVFVVAAILVALGALLTWWAWNTFMVYMFGVKSIGFLQALALNVLLACVKGIQISKKS